MKTTESAFTCTATGARVTRIRLYAQRVEELMWRLFYGIPA